jgi:hypothetical protein
MMMAEPIKEAGEQVQVAREKAAEAREVLESDPGEDIVEDPTVMDTINSALYDMDYALAKATLATKLYLDEVAYNADEGYDDLVEELSDVRGGVRDFWEDLTDSSPARAIGARLRGLEERLVGLLDRLTGEGKGDG